MLLFDGFNQITHLKSEVCSIFHLSFIDIDLELPIRVTYSQSCEEYHILTYFNCFLLAFLNQVSKYYRLFCLHDHIYTFTQIDEPLNLDNILPHVFNISSINCLLEEV